MLLDAARGADRRGRGHARGIRDGHVEALDGIARRADQVLVIGLDARPHHDGHAIDEDGIGTVPVPVKLTEAPVSARRMS